MQTVAPTRPAPLTLTHDRSLAVLHLDDGRGNALGETMLRALQAALHQARDADALLLRGRDKVFCGGLDLGEVVPKDRPAMEAFVALFDETFRMLLAYDRPIVTAVAGSAIAGGAILLACTDERLGARDAGRIGVNEVRLGIPFPASAREAVRAGLGEVQGARAMLAGDLVDKTEALHRGWLHTLHEAEALQAHALERAHDLATLPGPASAVVKRALRAQVLARLDADAEPARQAFVHHWCAPEAQRRLQAVLATLKK